MTDQVECRTMLNQLIDSWEKLPGGRRHSASAVQAWLDRHMTPNINRARVMLGRPIPDGEKAS